MISILRWLLGIRSPSKETLRVYGAKAQKDMEEFAHYLDAVLAAVKSINSRDEAE